MANNGSGEVLEHLLPVLKVPALIPSADLEADLTSCFFVGTHLERWLHGITHDTGLIG